MRWSAFLWLVSVPGLALAGDCPDFDSLGASAETAAQRLTQAEALYPAIYDNIGEFSELGPWVVDGVSCLTVPISPALAARYHRFRALQEDPLGGLSEAVRERACLLYTSPSPRDKRQSRMPSSA